MFCSSRFQKHGSYWSSARAATHQDLNIALNAREGVIWNERWTAPTSRCKSVRFCRERNCKELRMFTACFLKQTLEQSCVKIPTGECYAPAIYVCASVDPVSPYQICRCDLVQLCMWTSSVYVKARLQLFSPIRRKKHSFHNQSALLPSGRIKATLPALCACNLHQLVASQGLIHHKSAP